MPQVPPSDKATHASGQLQSQSPHFAVITQSSQKATSRALTELWSCEPRWLTNVDTDAGSSRPIVPFPKLKLLDLGGQGLFGRPLLCSTKRLPDDQSANAATNYFMVFKTILSKE